MNTLDWNTMANVSVEPQSTALRLPNHTAAFLAPGTSPKPAGETTISISTRTPHSLLSMTRLSLTISLWDATLRARTDVRLPGDSTSSAQLT